MKTITIPTEAYPLTWPAGVKRSDYWRKANFFGTRTGQQIQAVLDELRKLGARNVVISSNMPVRPDGIPYADGPQQPNGDPGVAVYWSVSMSVGGEWRLVPYCMPCDKWNRIADNLHAIALSINAMRGLDRWGAVTVEQAFAGFAELPPGQTEAAPAARPWRDVIGGPWPELPPDELLDLVRGRYRRSMKLVHPDIAGPAGAAVSAELNVAMEEAERELGGAA
jgi:hypothetical protein